VSTPSEPETIDRAEIAALIARTDPWSLDEREGPRLRQLLALLLTLIDEVESKQTTIHKLERMLFGPSSEARRRFTAIESCPGRRTFRLIELVRPSILPMG
jgi:hypothetical protein